MWALDDAPATWPLGLLRELRLTLLAYQGTPGHEPQAHRHPNKARLRSGVSSTLVLITEPMLSA